jgi:hypothetical protein
MRSTTIGFALAPPAVALVSPPSPSRSGSQSTKSSIPSGNTIASSVAAHCVGFGNALATSLAFDPHGTNTRRLANRRSNSAVRTNRDRSTRAFHRQSSRAAFFPRVPGFPRRREDSNASRAPPSHSHRRRIASLVPHRSDSARSETAI